MKGEGGGGECERRHDDAGNRGQSDKKREWVLHGRSTLGSERGTSLASIGMPAPPPPTSAKRTLLPVEWLDKPFSNIRPIECFAGR